MFGANIDWINPNGAMESAYFGWANLYYNGVTNTSFEDFVNSNGNYKLNGSGVEHFSGNGALADAKFYLKTGIKASVGVGEAQPDYGDWTNYNPSGYANEYFGDDANGEGAGEPWLPHPRRDQGIIGESSWKNLGVWARESNLLNFDGGVYADKDPSNRAAIIIANTFGKPLANINPLVGIADGGMIVIGSFMNDGGAGVDMYGEYQSWQGGLLQMIFAPVPMDGSAVFVKEFIWDPFRVNVVKDLTRPADQNGN
jgi:hypothetical protein